MPGTSAAEPTARVGADTWKTASVQLDADVRQYWYPVALASEVNSRRPHAVRLLGEPLVLYRDTAGKPRVLHDRCPHKSAQLSIGRIHDGSLECFYHGWKFDGESGAITSIPALPKHCALPSYKVKTFPIAEKDKLIWVWPGDPGQADPGLIPTQSVQGGMSRSEVCFDLPCDHALLIENLLDMAHTPFVHDGAFNLRSDARPTEPEFRMTPSGLAGRVKMLLRGRAHTSDFFWHAPCTNELRIQGEGGWLLHMYFYSVPTAPNQTRHMFIMHRNWGRFLDYLPWRFMDPEFDIFWADIMAVMSQARNIREGAPPMSLSTPADEACLKYRRWHNRAFGTDGGSAHGGPWWRGWSGALDLEDLANSAAEATLPCFKGGLYERASAACADQRPLRALWEEQHRLRPTLRDGDRPGLPLWLALALGAAAGTAAALALHRRW